MRPLEPYEGACCYRITRCPIGCAHDMVRPSISTPPITESTTFTADWLDPATIGCPQMKIGEDNLWYVSYDDGKTWTSLGVKATGATGEKGDKGDKGATGAAGAAGRDGRDGLNGQDGVGIVSAEINADGHLILTYTNGKTTDLGVVVGADGLTPFIGDNGNWWIGELDTGVKAAASSEAASPVTIVLGAAAGLALAGNIALALTLRRVLKKKELV